MSQDEKKIPGKSPDEDPPATGFPLEIELARRLGIAREILTEYRKEHFAQQQDFVLERAGIAYTPAGLDKVMAWLGAKKIGAGKPKPVLLVVVRKVPNPLIVLARKHGGDAKGALATLKVPTVVLNGQRVNFFTVGALVPALHDQGSVWRFHGAAPRSVQDMKHLARRAGLSADVETQAEETHAS